MRAKIKYTLRLIGSLAFLLGAIGLTYWLLAVVRVSNFFALILIMIFLVIPGIISVSRIPREIRWLFLVWRSDDPESLEELMGDVREHEIF